MSEIGIKATVKVNELHDQLRDDITKLWDNMSIDAAEIYNNTADPVRFTVYNYIDTVYLVPSMQTTIAARKSGKVACSGKLFKVHPHDSTAEQFLAAPQKVYLYEDKGNVSEIQK